MSQALQIEGLVSPSGERWHKHINTFFSALLHRAEKSVDGLVQYRLRHARINSANGRYARFNRHTWHRYSALIVAREQAIVAARGAVNTLSATETSAITEHHAATRRVSFKVMAIQLHPIWASAAQDWSPFE